MDSPVGLYVAVRDRSQSRRRVGFLRDGLDRAFPCWTRAWLLEIAARRSINQRAAERFFGFFWGVSARDGAPCDVRIILVHVHVSVQYVSVREYVSTRRTRVLPARLLGIATQTR